MSTPANSLDITQAGLVKFDGTSSFTGVTVTNHRVIVGGASNSLTSLAAGTTGQVLQSAGASDPAFSTATYPLTTTANQILFSSATNTVSEITAVNNGVLITSNAGVPSLLVNGTTGQVLTATTGAPPSWTSAAAGTVTSVSGTANRITSTGGSTPVIDISAAYVGQNSITTLGTISTGTWNGTTIAVANGGTGATSLTTHGVVIGEGTGPVGVTVAGTSGQLLQSGGAGTDPNWTTSTYPATNAVNTLLFASSANAMAALATANDGVLITSNTGVPSWLANGTTGQMLTATTGAAPSWSTPSSGTVTSVSGTANRITSTGGSTPVIDISAAYVGQNSITTLGTVTTGIWNASTIAVGFGGTGDTTLTAHGVLIGEGTSAIAATSAGTSGQLLQSKGASANPDWTTATFPSTAGTTGNVLTSDGTNWTSAAPAGVGFQSATVTLTSAQVKALHGTPIQIIAAPGASKAIFVNGATAKFIYGGNNAFTAGAAQTIGIYWNNGGFPITSSLLTNGMITSTANKFSILPSVNGTSVNQAVGVLDNVNIAIYNSVATEISGNAANDNTIEIIVYYFIITY